MSFGLCKEPDVYRSRLCVSPSASAERIERSAEAFFLRRFEL